MTVIEIEVGNVTNEVVESAEENQPGKSPDTPLEGTEEQPKESTAEPSNSSEIDHNAAIEHARAEAQKEYEERLEEAKEQHAQASIRVMEIAKELKDAKREQKEALEFLFSFQLAGPQLPTVAPKKKGKTKEEPTKELSPDLEKLIESDKTWRDISTGETISGIPGLGVKKYEAIVEAFPSIGLLEDARGEASKSFKEFREVLPEGIGAAMADKIQERMFDVMKKHWNKLREKIAVANEEKNKEATANESTEQPVESAQTGITVSIDDALLDDSDLI